MEEYMNGTDRLCWFPMRVTYHREQKVKMLLDELSVENFLPMQYRVVDTREGRKRMLVPAVPNLIFLRSTKDVITELKQTRAGLHPLRFIMRHSMSEVTKEILTVPDVQMENFIKAASADSVHVSYLDNLDMDKLVGRKVRIVDGDFAGVEGYIKRIKKNKCVVVPLLNLAALKIEFVPSNLMVMISE